MTISLQRPGATHRPTPQGDAERFIDQLRRLPVPGAAVDPSSSDQAEPRDATLLTGATGFLGRHLLRELLRTTNGPVICLVRAVDDAEARHRIAAVLAEAAGPEDAVLAERSAWAASLARGRVHAYAARLDQARLGLKEAVFQRLSRRVDSVLHAAAEVNWIKGYRRLRDANVLPTAGIVGFCLQNGVRRLQFVSTLAVCFSRMAPAEVTERDAVFDWIDGMPLAYAQTKAVSEQLLRHAAERGLAVTIVRPGLLCGDSRTGASNPGDIVTALLATCVRLRSAPDVDWTFDSLPVDYAARAIVALGARQRAGLKIRHLRHARPRHWRELALWLKLSGHPLVFRPVEQWLDLVFGSRQRPAADPAPLPLSSFRRFFVSGFDEGSRVGTREAAGVLEAVAGAERPFELYLSQRQHAIVSHCTERLLARLSLPMPALDGTLLRRYFAYFEAMGILPRPARGDRIDSAIERVARYGAEQPAGEGTAGGVPRALLRGVALTLTGDASRPLRWLPQPFDARDGLLAETACAGAAEAYGLRRYRVDGDGATPASSVPATDLVIKLKPCDRQLTDAVLNAVEMLDPAAARALRTDPVVFGFERSHVREAEIQTLAPPAVRPYLPRCFGSSRPCGEDAADAVDVEDPGNASQAWGLAIEYLPEGTSRWSRRDGWGWRRIDRQAAIAAMSDLHAAWQPLVSDAAVRAALGVPLDADAGARLRPAWCALAALASSSWTRLIGRAGHELADLHRELVDSVGDWWRELAALPQTVVHNDFNPRNLALARASNRRDSSGEAAWAPVRVRVLDWELAAIGPPQQDFVELLCHVWPEDEGEAAFWADADAHRSAYAARIGTSIPAPAAGAGAWRRGLELALRRLLLQRLPLYAIADRFQPQPYLPTLLRNWLRLYGWTGSGSGSEAGSRPAGRPR
ncbi:MAG: thioester reductase domain-containing protein [Burkholderiaceae bacterium]